MLHEHDFDFPGVQEHPRRAAGAFAAVRASEQGFGHRMRAR